jgi:hypothetical protein
MFSTAANAGELLSREPSANDEHNSFTLTFQDGGQLSRSDGPGSETG